LEIEGIAAEIPNKYLDDRSTSQSCKCRSSSRSCMFGRSLYASEANKTKQ
jgi:hypothetical protein